MTKPPPSWVCPKSPNHHLFIKQQVSEWKSERKRFHLHFTEILTLSLIGSKFTSSGLTVNSYVPLSNLCERIIVIVDWLSVKLKKNRSWKSFGTWIVPPLLYLATLFKENERKSGVKIISTSSRGVPPRVYVHWRVMLSFSSTSDGLEGVEIKDAACSFRNNKKNSLKTIL